MSNVDNPGQVSVEDEVYGNPDPNGSDLSLAIPEVPDDAEQIADQGYSPAVNGVDSEVFPTPTDVRVTGVPFGGVVNFTVPPLATEVDVGQQVLGQGVWVWVDPLNPAAGKRFLAPGEFVVVGPATTIQTNNADTTEVLCTITAVYDADDLFNAPTANTTRFRFVIAAPALSSYLVSVLGREVVFAEDTLTTAIAGAVRNITFAGNDFVVVDSENPDDEDVPTLVLPGPVVPQVGDTFWLDVQREGAQDISEDALPTINVVILPPPPVFVANPGQALGNQGTINVALVAQPGTTIISSGTAAPTATTVEVANQATSVGLPKNVFV